MITIKKEHNLPEIISGKDPIHIPSLKFETYGEEMIEKEVKSNGANGRIYLPPDWVGKQVKIIRIN